MSSVTQICSEIDGSRANRVASALCDRTNTVNVISRQRLPTTAVIPRSLLVNGFAGRAHFINIGPKLAESLGKVPNNQSLPVLIQEDDAFRFIHPAPQDDVVYWKFAILSLAVPARTFINKTVSVASLVEDLVNLERARVEREAGDLVGCQQRIEAILLRENTSVHEIVYVKINLLLRTRLPYGPWKDCKDLAIQGCKVLRGEAAAISAEKGAEWDMLMKLMQEEEFSWARENSNASTMTAYGNLASENVFVSPATATRPRRVFYTQPVSER